MFEVARIGHCADGQEAGSEECGKWGITYAGSHQQEETFDITIGEFSTESPKPVQQPKILSIASIFFFTFIKIFLKQIEIPHLSSIVRIQ